MNIMKAFGGTMLHPGRGGEMIRCFNAMNHKQYRRFKLSVLHAAGISRNDPRFDFLNVGKRTKRRISKPYGKTRRRV